MVRPAYPVSGETVEAAWGVAAIDYIAQHGRFVRNPAAGGWQIQQNPGKGFELVELTHLPANDPTIYAAQVQMLYRSKSGNTGSYGGGVLDYDPVAASHPRRPLLHYAGPVAGRGGSSGDAEVRVGGVNNRQIIVEAAAECEYWLRVAGWWVRENASDA